MGMINTTDYPSYAKVTPVDEIEETPKAEVDENKAEVA